MHRRTQIRNYVADLLADIALIGKSRVHNWKPENLPAIAVYTLEEAVDDTVPREIQDRRVEVVLDIFDASTGDVDTDLDGLCVQVEAAMAADDTLGGLARYSTLTRTTIGLDGASDQRVGLARMVFAVDYRTVPGEPDQ